MPTGTRKGRSYNPGMDRRICRLACMLLGSVLVAAGAAAQTPQPFPKPGEPSRPAQPPRQAPPGVKVLPPEPQPPAAPPAAPADPAAPTEQTIGMPLYPGAQFLTSYDAGRGQRFYLFGTNVDFAEIVAYYRTVLKQRGSLVYEQPAIHAFDIGRYRSDAVAFPPGISVKDYTFGGSPGYLNPAAGAQPSHFRTVIQVVPPPPGEGAGR